MIKDLSFEQEKKLANSLYYGGGVTQKYIEGGSLIPQGGVDFNAGPKDLQSSARTGNISGGTRDERKEARGEREPGSGPINAMAVVGAGLGVASSAIDTLDTDDKYGGADVASSTLKYASMGAVAGPWGAAAGAAVGLGVGLVQKSKFKKQEKKEKRDKEQNEGYDSFMKGQEEFAGYQEGGTIKPTKELDYEQDPAYKKIKAKYEAEAAFMKKIQGDDYKDEFFNQFNSTYSDNTRVSLPDKDRLDMFKTNVEQNWDSTPLEERKTYMSTFKTGGMTKGAYSHSTNPLTVVDKGGKPTGMELTGGEGVFDKPFMGKLQGLLTGGKYQEAGKAVQNEMKTWKHK